MRWCFNVHTHYSERWAFTRFRQCDIFLEEATCCNISLQHTVGYLGNKCSITSEKMDENGIIFKHVESWRCIVLLKNYIKSTKQELEQLFTGCSIPPRNVRFFSIGVSSKGVLIHFNMSYWFGRNCFWKQTLHFKCAFLRSYFPKSEYVYSLLKAQYSLKGAICNVYKKCSRTK